MFLENASQKGWIEVICGSMFSGKTEELIRRLKRAEFARLRVEIFKPRIDVRYSEEEVVSHDASAIRSTPVDSAQNILLMTSDVDVVGIDEAQFFDQGLVEVCRQLADSGVRVIVAGLDMDFTGKPFGPMPALMATAEYVTKVHAICVRCGNLAHHSHRLTSDEKQVMLGAQDSYEPICRHCFAELRKKSGNKRHLPVKIRTFSGPYASEAYNSIRQSPPQEGIVLRINATENQYPEFPSGRKTENTSHEAQNILNISRQGITRSASYTPEYTGKFTIFASDRRIPHSLRRRCRLPSALPSYPPQNISKRDRL